MNEEFPVLATTKALKGFPDIKTGPVLKAFPDIEIGQVLKIHRDELGEPHSRGDSLGIVILPAFPGEEGLRIGSVVSDAATLDDTVADQADALGAVAVTVLEPEEDWVVVVSVTDIQAATDD
jgi:hypothetical protein